MAFLYSMTKTLARDLKLADIVQLSDGPFMTATVFKIETDMVHLKRPYIQPADFSHGGEGYKSVIVYIGTEDIAVHRDDTRPLDLLRRGGPLK